MFNGKFDVYHYNEDCFGHRVEHLSRCEGIKWIKDVKQATMKYGELCKFGDYHKNRLRVIKPCDIVLILVIPL